MESLDAVDGGEVRSVLSSIVEYASTPGEEAAVVAWFRDRLEEWGFETVTWEADANVLAEHPSFPDDPAAIDVADRPSVGGVLEFGDPDAGRTLVLNGHVDVVPASEGSWSSPPFEATWNGDELTARGAADMKGGVVAAAFAARAAAERARDRGLDGRLVVEAVAGEEEGGIGAASAALDSPYDFERDACIVAEPTELDCITAVEGSLMGEIRLEGRSAHAATRWRGESAIEHFERVHEALRAFERERDETITHPLYDEFPIRWPVNVGTVRAGEWASSVPAALEAGVRVGVAPGETVDEVEGAVRERLRAVADADAWTRDNPPVFEREGIQFEPAAVDVDEPVVDAVRDAMTSAGLDDEPHGATYGADSRHYVAAGIPTVVFGPGSIDQAHFPDETVDVTEVREAAAVIADAAVGFLDGE
ncbi:ArgE/DapE family deacylase [Halorubellus sp. JP-L1]|uniref:ArgE/DapE family deacylase n=1 Tax=Halorubellus sp. JP-L1 TaxID=2715753 RepID=UPI00140A7EE5|nr:ArgE/DapE family deacylase [Halorubellus sp. JP-L1]NHN41705.1 ArgE/DapE family deacylase [Halorubellus sp. JP-L1]